MSRTEFELSSNANGKCLECKVAMVSGDHILGVREIFDSEFAGSFFYRHAKCTPKQKLIGIKDKYHTIKGWDGLSSDDQTELTQIFNGIITAASGSKPTKAKARTPKDKGDKAEKKDKKRKSPDAKNSKKKKSKKKDEDDDEEEEEEEDAEEEQQTKKKQKKEKDVNAPCPALSAFFLFSADHREQVKASGLKASEVASKLGEMWKSADQHTKANYKAKQDADKERYKRQMEEYRQNGKFTDEHGNIAEGAGVIKARQAKAAAAKKAQKALEAGSSSPSSSSASASKSASSLKSDSTPPKILHEEDDKDEDEEQDQEQDQEQEHQSEENEEQEEHDNEASDKENQSNQDQDQELDPYEAPVSKSKNQYKSKSIPIQIFCR